MRVSDFMAAPARKKKSKYGRSSGSRASASYRTARREAAKVAYREAKWKT